MSSERIMEVVVEELRKWPTGTDEIKDDSRLEEDLGLDMLDRMEVVMDLEDEFGVTIEDGELVTVGDLVKAIQAAQPEEAL